MDKKKIEQACELAYQKELKSGNVRTLNDAFLFKLIWDAAVMVLSNPVLVCVSDSFAGFLTKGKEYEQFAIVNDDVTIIDDYGNMGIFNMSFFESSKNKV